MDMQILGFKAKMLCEKICDTSHSVFDFDLCGLPQL